MPQITMTDNNASRSAQDTFLDLIKSEGSFQYLREFVQNSLEAEAQDVHITYEPEAWDKYRIARMMFLDNGKGLSKDEFKLMLNLNASGKDTTGYHANFGIGAKISALGFNHHGLVILSWRGDEAYMARIKMGEKDGKQIYVMGNDLLYSLGEDNSIESSDGDVINKPCYIADLFVDFSKTLKTIKSYPIFKRKNSGTAVILCGSHPFESTQRRNAQGKLISGAEVSNYLNNRYYELPDVSLRFISQPLPRKYNGLHKSYDEYERALYTRWIQLKSDNEALEEFLTDSYLKYIMCDEENSDFISNLDDVVEEEDDDEEGEGKIFFPNTLPEDDFLSFIKKSWLTVKPIDKKRPETILGTKKLLMKKSTIKGLELKFCEANGTLSFDNGISLDWYIINPGLKLSSKRGEGKPIIDSHAISLEHQSGCVALLYNNEVFNRKYGSAASKELEKFNIPTKWENPSLPEGLLLANRLQFYIRFPLVPVNSEGEGVRQDKWRTKLVWERSQLKKYTAHEEEVLDYSEGNIPWNRAYSKFKEQMPQEILDLIEKYRPTPNSLDDLRGYHILESVSSPKGTTEEKVCPLCKNLYRHRCGVCSKENINTQCKKCSKDRKDCVCPKLTRTAKAKTVFEPTIVITWLEEPDYWTHRSVTDAEYASTKKGLSIISVQVTDNSADVTINYASPSILNIHEHFLSYAPKKPDTEVTPSSIKQAVQQVLGTALKFFICGQFVRFSLDQGKKKYFDNISELINGSTLDAKIMPDNGLFSLIAESLSLRFYEETIREQRAHLLKSRTPKEPLV
jgi:hypothetical protein